jgi:hypothetical protein
MARRRRDALNFLALMGFGGYFQRKIFPRLVNPQGKRLYAEA